MARKSFSQHVHDTGGIDGLHESLIAKGFAIGQQSRFTNTKAQLKSILARVQTATRASKSSQELEDKLNHLGDAIFQLADALEIESELLASIIKVGVASALFDEDLSAQFSKKR